MTDKTKIEDLLPLEKIEKSGAGLADFLRSSASWMGAIFEDGAIDDRDKAELESLAAHMQQVGSRIFDRFVDEIFVPVANANPDRIDELHEWLTRAVNKEHPPELSGSLRDLVELVDPDPDEGSAGEIQSECVSIEKREAA